VRGKGKGVYFGEVRTGSKAGNRHGREQASFQTFFKKPRVGSRTGTRTSWRVSMRKRFHKSKAVRLRSKAARNIDGKRVPNRSAEKLIRGRWRDSGGKTEDREADEEKEGGQN